MPSTAIRRFTYEPDARTLDVTFITGRRYRYFAVPGDVAQEFRKASSKGQFFNACIRDHFRFEELQREDG